MTVDKLSLPAKNNAVQEKINEIIDKYIEDKATGLWSISIDGLATSHDESINIGLFSVCGSDESTAVGVVAQTTGADSHNSASFGYHAQTYGGYSIALGSYAMVGTSTSDRADYAIQIGYGTNTLAKTLSIGFYDDTTPTNWQLLDGATGLIPTARLSTFTGADGTNAGTAGIVPAPTATDNDKYLKGDGTWATVSGGGGTATDVRINGTSITQNNIADILTNSAYSSNNKIATMSDVPTETTVSGWGFTKNTGTVTSVNNVLPVNGNVALSIPSQTDVQINGTSITSGGTANILTNTAYNASSNKIATMSDLPTVVTYTGGTGISIGTGNAINHTNSITAGTAGTSSATSGSTLSVPYVTYDAQGHVTASGTHTHTVTGFLTSITSSDVTNALGYTPYNSTNPDGYITSSDSLVASTRFDGQWTWKYQSVESGSDKAVGSYSYALSSYLPDTTNKYEVFVRTRAEYSASVSIYAMGTVASPADNMSSSGQYFFQAYVAQYSRVAASSFILPFNANGTLYYQVKTAKIAGLYIDLCGYRRIGTNS